jgi:hypothetical protein
MSGRSLIIAIEQYADSLELARQITGATAAAERFWTWVTGDKGVPPENVLVCADGGTFGASRRYATDREHIVDAIADLVAAGQDRTEELFVFFSGHGFCFSESIEKRAVDVLVASDFVSAAASGTKCIRLQEVQEKLYAILGGNHHYYFIDACRTMVGTDDIDPIPLGRKLGRQAQRGKPTKYTLFSTAYGDPAAINSAFASALIDGLKGHGRAKGFTPAGHLFVMFPLLCSYVQQQVRGQRIDQIKEGSGDGFIVQIEPVPEYECAIRIQGADPADTFRARIAQSSDPTIGKDASFQGAVGSLTFRPGDFVLSVFEGDRPLPRRVPPERERLDFFDRCEAIFAKAADTAPLAGGPPPAGRGSINHDLPSGVQVRARNLNTGHERTLTSAEGELPAGDYEFSVRERGSTIQKRMAQVLPSRAARLSFRQTLDPVRDSIIRAVHGNVEDGVVNFSKSLGPISNRDLGLWLTIIGASEIVGDPTTLSELRDLPLDRVDTLREGKGRVYALLAPGESGVRAIKVQGDWVRPRAVKTLTGVYQATVPLRSCPGSMLIAIDFGKVTRTFASYCLPNRVTFFVVADDDGQLLVHQFLLPARHLVSKLPREVVAAVGPESTPLETMRAAYNMQRQFGRARAIKPPHVEERRAWDDLLHGKWLDPVMSLLASYEVLRRGDDGIKSTLSNVIVPNLERFFPGIPDTAAIAVSLGMDRPQPSAPPLFRDGLLAFPDWEDTLPLPAGRLEFGYIWTTWRGKHT